MASSIPRRLRREPPAPAPSDTVRTARGLTRSSGGRLGSSDDTRPVCMFGLLLALFLTLALLAPSDAKPAHAVQMDAIDTCLFTCDACYKGEALLACANTCLQVDGQMIGTAWQQTCPYFRKKPLFMDIF